MNVQRSLPIPIQNDRSRRKAFVHLDTPPDLTNSYCSFSPNLSAPTPPNFVPKEPHVLSKIGGYLLTEETELSVFRALDAVTHEETKCKVVEAKKYTEKFAPNFKLEPHDNISQIQEVLIGEEKAYAFFLRDYGDMHQYVRSKRKLKEEEASRLFYQMVLAVVHCHEAGIVLRDLKLRKFTFKNAQRTELMLEGLEDAYILDNSNRDLLCDKHGCPAYVSPEILNSEPCYSGKCADVWSLGVILYTMLVGRYPFHDTEPSSLFTKIRRGKFTVPDFVSSQAKCLLRSIMRVEPAERLTAEEVLHHPWFRQNTGVINPFLDSSKMLDQTVPDFSLPESDDIFL
ncbi:tribbles homolog 2-like [Acanthaster planci]|uniref:Tribbles homolog 2-like n=1 Tax=Acanthaster planci TaxID=133434 RepID=A0A8B7ZLK9_ACAPL|nr:tribbles homolog 2-like [Acanthaster planci]